MNVTTEELAAALIAVLEGNKLTAYCDSGGILTIGVGHCGPDVHGGMVITPEQAAELFARDAAPLFAMVKDLPILSATALVSFGYNCGQGTLHQVLTGHDLISNPKHTTDRKGNVLPGLVNRRRFEELLCLVSQQLSGK